MRIIATVLALVVCLVAGPGTHAGAAQRIALCNITTTSRVVAVGDVHGAFDKYVAILKEAKLIDGRQRWIGGDAILIQLGDVLDRGPASRQALDLIRRLEGDAARAGGGVVFLLGNHEVMRMAGDYRYVSDAEYAAFKSDSASDLRERLYEHVAAERSAQARAKGEKFDAKEFRKTFLTEIPLGSVEMQMAFSDTGEYGRWLRDHEIMARINGIAFVHGGLTPAFATGGCEAANARARAELQKGAAPGPDPDKTLLWSPEGPLWFRGLVSDPPAASSADDVTAVLKALGASRIVVGHTVDATHRIRPLYDGRVLQIDTGMVGGDFFPGGVPSALEILDGKLTAIYVGKREELR